MFFGTSDPTIAGLVRKFAFGVKIFTRRDLLQFGNGNAVDQEIYRLTKDGELKRVARGVYCRPDYLPSATEIIQIKAKALGRSIVTADEKELINNSTNSEALGEVAADSHRTSFEIFEPVKESLSRVQLKIKAARKRILEGSPAGRAILYLWSLKQDGCTPAKILEQLAGLSRIELKRFFAAHRWMPWWLSDLVHQITSLVNFSQLSGPALAHSHVVPAEFWDMNTFAKS